MFNVVSTKEKKTAKIFIEDRDIFSKIFFKSIVGNEQMIPLIFLNVIPMTSSILCSYHYMLPNEHLVIHERKVPFKDIPVELRAETISLESQKRVQENASKMESLAFADEYFNYEYPAVLSELKNYFLKSDYLKSPSHRLDPVVLGIISF